METTAKVRVAQFKGVGMRGDWAVRDSAMGNLLRLLPRPPISMLGVPFANVSLSQAIDRIETMVASGKPHQVVTANVDFLVQARKDDELRRIFVDASLVLCDGAPLVWASRLLGNPLPERVAGADLTPRLIEVAARKGWRLFFLGGAEAVTEQAVATLRTRFPNVTICGHYSPPFAPLEEMNHADIIRRVREARPDILFVSFGCPKAEKWIAQHAATLGVPVLIGVGGTVDFLSGRIKRAPLWMQRAGLEWLFRLGQEPRRLARRYARDLWEFVWPLVGQWWWLHSSFRRNAGSDRAWLVLLEKKWQSIEMPEILDSTTVVRNAAVWARAASRDSIVDLEGVRFIDSTGAGLLLWLRRKFTETGRRLVLLAPSRAVSRALRQLRVGQFFPISDSVEEVLESDRPFLHPESPIPRRTPFPVGWRGFQPRILSRGS
jgi:N-acetylglucosaminyldiphosphoundecaprenol N-acetyl-beta-D-mannosaminyltransferase